MDKNCPLRHPGKDFTRKSNSSSSKFPLLPCISITPCGDPLTVSLLIEKDSVVCPF